MSVVMGKFSGQTRPGELTRVDTMEAVSGRGAQAGPSLSSGASRHRPIGRHGPDLSVREGARNLIPETGPFPADGPGLYLPITGILCFGSTVIAVLAQLDLAYILMPQAATGRNRGRGRAPRAAAAGSETPHSSRHRERRPETGGAVGTGVADGEGSPAPLHERSDPAVRPEWSPALPVQPGAAPIRCGLSLRP